MGQKLGRHRRGQADRRHPLHEGAARQPAPFTRSIRPRKSRSFMGCLPTDCETALTLPLLARCVQGWEQAGGRPSMPRSTPPGAARSMTISTADHARAYRRRFCRIQILVDNVTDLLSSVPSFVETEFAGLGRAAPRGLGAWRRLPVLRRARSFLPAHDPQWRQGAYRAFRHRAGRPHLRAECLAAGNRSRISRGHGAEPRPLGSRRRHAARAPACARPQRRARRCLLHAPRHVPQPRHQAGRRFVPADGGCAVGCRPAGKWRPRRLLARSADDCRRHGVCQR